jgi:hypothetical protein
MDFSGDPKLLELFHQILNGAWDSAIQEQWKVEKSKFKKKMSFLLEGTGGPYWDTLITMFKKCSLDTAFLEEHFSSEIKGYNGTLFIGSKVLSSNSKGHQSGNKSACQGYYSCS